MDIKKLKYNRLSDILINHPEMIKHLPGDDKVIIKQIFQKMKDKENKMINKC